MALKYTFNFYHPVVVIFFRMILSSICFLLLYKKLGGSRYQRGDWKYLVLMCLCEPCLFFLLEGMALQYTSASQAGMVTAVLPLLVAVLAWRYLHERISRKTLVGFLITVSGAVWLSVVSKSTSHASDPLLGNMLELAAICCGAVYSVLLKRLSSRYSPWFLTAMQGFIGSFFFMLFLPVVPWPEHFDTLATIAVVYLGVGVTLGAYLLFNLALSTIPSNQATTFTNLIPVFSIIFSVLLLGETLSANQWIACIVILCGVALSQSFKGSRIPLASRLKLDTSMNGAAKHSPGDGHQ